MTESIQMVDLKTQYHHIKNEIDQAVINCIESTAFINGPAVKEFQSNLESYLGVKHVIPCANGTDSLQIAMMALGLQRGDEVICPSFTYVATAEVIGLLGLVPVMVEVDSNTFNITAEIIEKAITSKTKAIVPVHLYGQSCDMEPIMELAKRHNLFVIEDNAQAIGATYTFSNGTKAKTGTIGHIGSTSFFPSKNLGCYGDGGALMTNDDELALKMRMIANHGQEKKYFHKVLGCNSRLDTIQAAILNIKLRYLDDYSEARNRMASFYDSAFTHISDLDIPTRQFNSSHVFHQYTLKVKNGRRNELQKFLSEKGIPSMIYYPLPLYKQDAFCEFVDSNFRLPITESLCEEVISLPVHTEMNLETMEYICNNVKSFFIN
ncbi:DegT/DnrJ/EryC1/StrS family aminotransferase [Flavobacterium sp.]|uniref:DegT/DnrJ/EryC1/StrS family aminotransferase n=1 Tax=Flavobacterium sp. TaxID=239 RepID=UPI0025BE765B|nr:DegT/DnrJ/EryC1/StrS family aminotransferase [Flavobacterium sp.]